MQGFGKWKKLIQLWKQLDGGYTLMLVPHDGRSISKKDLHTRQMKKAASCIGVVALGTVGLVVLLSGMLYVRNKEANELAAYKAIKAQQEQKLQELEKNTEAVQKQLAMLHKIETQVREQMKKAGMELPGKSEPDANTGGKGGPMKHKISDLVILQKQNALLQQNLQLSTKDWDNLLTSIKAENYRNEVTPNLWPLDGGYGKYIKISHDYGYATAYGHLSSIEISAGDYVSKGQIIGYVGSTGYSTGPHLHFEVLLYGEQVNPRRLIK